jgi:hypothetical protein
MAAPTPTRRWLQGLVILVLALLLGAVGGIVATSSGHQAAAPAKVKLVERADATSPTTSTVPSTTTTTSTTAPPPQPRRRASGSVSPANHPATAGVTQTDDTDPTTTTTTTTTPDPGGGGGGNGTPSGTGPDPPPPSYCMGSLAADQSTPSWPYPTIEPNGDACTDTFGTFDYVTKGTPIGGNQSLPANEWFLAST